MRAALQCAPKKLCASHSTPKQALGPAKVGLRTSS